MAKGAAMRSTSLQRERIILADPTDIRLRPNVGYAAITSPEAIGLAIFCLFGLLLTAAFNLFVPNFADVAASLQPYF
jgi:hypothetical protein